MSSICLAFSSILTAFNYSTIGSKVISSGDFLLVVHEAIGAHDFSKDRISGQAVIHIPEAIQFISGGMGKNRDNADDYVLRSHRGKVNAYLKRKFAEPVTDCNIVVYTRDAYLADLDIHEDPKELKNILDVYCTHVLVAILADCGVPSKLSPYRFVKNLAGGNYEALAWSADEIRAKASEIAQNIDGWSVVAD